MKKVKTKELKRLRKSYEDSLAIHQDSYFASVASSATSKEVRICQVILHLIDQELKRRKEEKAEDVLNSLFEGCNLLEATESLVAEYVKNEELAKDRDYWRERYNRLKYNT